MGKNKLRKFAEMETLPNVFQCGARDLQAIDQIAAMAGHWNELYFHNSNPIVLELGCGRGEYTVALARLFPDKNFIGVDIKGARMWAGATEAHRDSLSNAAFLRTNIEMLPRFFAANEVDEIWITFPDPQMKKATKRLTSSYFLQRYQTCLRDGGIIHLKTDSPFLYRYTQEVVRLNNYPILTDTNNLYNKQVEIHDNKEEKIVEKNIVEKNKEEKNIVENKNGTTSTPVDDILLTIQTHYEKQWIERGMTIKYIQFRLLRKDAILEPTIDIEHDTYRSYGRNYPSTKPLNQ